MILNLCIGLCTPPVGSVLFVGVGVANTSTQKVINIILVSSYDCFLLLILIFLRYHSGFHQFLIFWF